MEAVKTIPQLVKTHNVEQVIIYPNPVVVDNNGTPENHYWVGIETRDELGQRYLQKVDFTAVINAQTAPNRTLVRAFLKRIVQDCLAVAGTDITGEVF